MINKLKLTFKGVCLSLLLTTVFHSTFSEGVGIDDGQSVRRIYKSEFLKLLLSNSTDTVKIENCAIMDEKVDLKVLFDRYDKDEMGRVIVNSVIIVDANFDNLGKVISLSNFHFKKSFTVFADSRATPSRLNLTNCQFDDQILFKYRSTEKIELSLLSCVFKNDLILVASFNDLLIDKCILYERALFNSEKTQIINSSIFLTGNIELNSENYFSISHSKITSSHRNNRLRITSKAIQDLNIDNNYFNCTLDLGGVNRIENSFNLVNNKFKHVSLGYFAFPDNSRIQWSQFSKSEIVVIGDSLELYTGRTKAELNKDPLYHELVRSYRNLISYFKEVGNIYDANECFVQMKIIESRWLKNNYLNKGGFRNLFAWQINNLLEFYSNFGTDPALSIIISIYVLLGFAAVYLLFPSDWDLTSKSILIRRFKHLIEAKNGNFFIRLFKLIFIISLSMVNALTLSLNAFTTLGFGAIPTRGAAKYFCVFEGFLGWFLLSIFTVALFNQVLI